jgi:hypothetical protein
MGPKAIKALLYPHVVTSTHSIFNKQLQNAVPEELSHLSNSAMRSSIMYVRSLVVAMEISHKLTWKQVPPYQSRSATPHSSMGKSRCTGSRTARSRSTSISPKRHWTSSRISATTRGYLYFQPKDSKVSASREPTPLPTVHCIPTYSSLRLFPNNNAAKSITKWPTLHYP